MSARPEMQCTRRLVKLLAVLAQQDIVESPAWLPLEASGDGDLRLIWLDEAAYRAASFLDQRLVGHGPSQAHCRSEVVRGAAAQLTPKAHYLFHTGHVGSTLVSRLVGEHDSLFCLREPAILRTFGKGTPLKQPSPPLGLDVQETLALLSRTWRPEQRAVIKVTSFLSDLAVQILSGDDRPAALFLFTDPLSYLRGILAGPSSRIESRALAPSRLRRLLGRLGEGAGHLDPASEGEQVAMSWLCEMAALHEAARRHRSRILWVNFDAFLLEPRSGLDTILRTLGATPSPGEIERLVAGPLMRQYSKAPEYAYDAALRHQVLKSADREHPIEIRRGIDWLARLAQRHPLVREILERPTAASGTSRSRGSGARAGGGPGQGG